MKCRNHSHGCLYKERLIFWLNDPEASVNLEKNQKLHDDFCDTTSAERKESKNHGLTETQKQIIDSCGLSAPKAIVTFFKTHHPDVQEPVFFPEFFQNCI